MKRIPKWLESKFSRHSAAVEADGPHTPVGVTTKENVKEDNSGSDHTLTLAILTSLEEPPFVVFDSTGFDPYNSGTFDSSKTWESHSRYKRAF
jgi:hypothetical protein